MVRVFFITILKAWKNILRNFSVSLASIVSITLSLFVFGIIFCIIVNINHMAYLVKERYNAMQVFISTDSDREAQEEIVVYLNQSKRIKGYSFKSSEQAMKEFRNRMQDNDYLFEGLPNFLEDSYVVHLLDPEDAQDVSTELKNLSAVSDVVYYQEILDKLLRLSNTVSKFGFFLMLFLMMISFFMISSTIKIAFFSYREEVSIMRCLGATNWFIRGPFFVEGILLGISGAFLSWMLLIQSYVFLQTSLVGDNILLASYFISSKELTLPIMRMFLLIGGGVGAVSSLFSLRRYLKV